jgi:hypothetical protein
MTSGCHGVGEHDRPCRSPVVAEAELGLCERHLLAAYDWIARDVGVTDLLPSPCLACGSRLGTRYPSGWLCAVCEWRYGDVPDAELVPPRVDVVYYIRFRDRVKIGTSARPRQRLAQLKHDELLAFERGDRRVEQRRHAQFGQYRYGTTEWFVVNDELERHIALLAHDDPWSSYALWVSQQIALSG